MKCATRGVTLHADGFARTTVIGDANGRSPLPQDPALSCLLRRERAAVTPTPPEVSLSRPRFTCPLPPSPAAPH